MSDPASQSPRKKSETRQRTVTIGFRAHQDEKAAFKMRASAAGFESLADFIRMRCDADPLGLTAEQRDLIRIEVALNRLGGLLNQIAALGHRTATVSADQYETARAILEEALQIIREEFRR